MSRALLYIYILLTIVSYPGNTWSQFNPTKTYTVSDGMPMSECSAVYCDRQGKIWTEHSNAVITSFDGRTFKSYFAEETGHYTSSMIREDKRGLWFCETRKSISLFQNDIWEYWPLPQLVRFEVDKKTDQIVVMDTLGQLLILDSISNSWIVAGKSPVLPKGYEYELHSSLIDTQYLLLIQKKFSAEPEPYQVFITSSLIQPEWIQVSDYKGLDFSWDVNSFDMGKFPHLKDHFPEGIHSSYNTYFHSSLSRQIFSTSRRAPNSTHYIIDVYVIDSLSKFKPYAKFLHSHNNLNLTIDKMGNLWGGSHKGLTRIFPYILECTDNHPNMIASIHVINEDEKGSIWFGGYSTGMAIFNGTEILPPPKEVAPLKFFLPGHYRDEMGNMAFWTEDFGMITYKNNQWNYSIRDPVTNLFLNGYYFLPVSNEIVAAGFQNHGLGLTTSPPSVDSKWKFISHDKGMKLQNVLTVTHDRAGRYWLGRTSQGVAVYDPQSDKAKTWLISEDSLMTFGMTSSTLDHEGRLWMGCSDGLRVIDAPDRVDITRDHVAQMSNKITMDEAGYSYVTLMQSYKNWLIFGNKEGYGFLNLKSYPTNKSSPQIFFYNTTTSTGACDQNTILLDSKGYVWIGQDYGAVRIDLEKLPVDTLPVKIIIDQINYRELASHTSTITLDSSLRVKMPLNKRSLNIPVQISFTGWVQDNVGLQYRLIHRSIQDTLWSAYSKNFNIQLDYLPPGESILEIRAIKNNQIADQKQVHIYIPPHLNERASFWILLIGGLGIIGFLITRYFYKQRIQLKQVQIEFAQQQREKNQFQVSAIANSLNPHFIKNTLMWMQSRFRKDEEVVDVIDRLAHNISSVFSHSRKGEAFHSLKDEIKVTDNFLAIQLATYGAFIKIEFPEEEQWMPYKDILVPLLQFQIHVENAIEHGLRKKSGGQKILSMTIGDDDTHLIVAITDNGIGRKAAKERGSRGTHQGTSMLDRVYELFNQKNEFHFSTVYEDLYNESGEALGTRVIIRIPKKYNTDLS